MNKSKNPNRLSIIVKRIAEHLDGLATLNRHVFVYKPNGTSFYIDNGVEVPADKFEKIHTVPLLKNKEYQNEGLDSRTNFY